MESLFWRLTEVSDLDAIDLIPSLLMCFSLLRLSSSVLLRILARDDIPRSEEIKEHLVEGLVTHISSRILSLKKVCSY